MGELLLTAVSLVLGVVLGGVVLVLVRLARMALRHASGRTYVSDPDGGEWEVHLEVVPPGLQPRVARRVFGMSAEERSRRRSTGLSEDAVSRRGVGDTFDMIAGGEEAAGLVAVVLLALVLVGLAVLLLELLVVLVGLLVVGAVRLTRGGWGVAVGAPGGTTTRHESDSFRGAMALRAELIDRIGLGLGPRP